MVSLKISGRKGAGYIAHNNREFSCKNVDATRTASNITYKKEALEEAYRKCFEKEFQEYNSKVRKDRRFAGTYLEKLRNSKGKQKEFYEWVIQVGDKESAGYDTNNWEEAEKILDEYMKGFQERNKQLYVFNAVMHRDESTPHVHIDYIPIANFEKGQKKRNSLTKALEQMGYGKSESRKNSNTIRWQKAEREEIRKIAREAGLEIDEEEHNRKKHLEVEEYKELQREKEAVKEEIKELRNMEKMEINRLADAFKNNANLMNMILRAVRIVLGKEKKYEVKKDIGQSR